MSQESAEEKRSKDDSAYTLKEHMHDLREQVTKLAEDVGELREAVKRSFDKTSTLQKIVLAIVPVILTFALGLTYYQDTTKNGQTGRLVQSESAIIQKVTEYQYNNCIHGDANVTEINFIQTQLQNSLGIDVSVLNRYKQKQAATALTRQASLLKPLTAPNCTGVPTP